MNGDDDVINKWIEINVGTGEVAISDNISEGDLNSSGVRIEGFPEEWKRKNVYVVFYRDEISINVAAEINADKDRYSAGIPAQVLSEDGPVKIVVYAVDESQTEPYVDVRPAVWAEISDGIESAELLPSEKDVGAYLTLLIDLQSKDTTVARMIDELGDVVAIKNKVDGIEEGAEVNVQSDWGENDTTSDSFIKNKPNLTEMEDRLREEIGLVNDVAQNAEADAGKIGSELDTHRNNGDVDINHINDNMLDALRVLYLAVNIVNSSNPNAIAQGSLGVGSGINIERGQSLGVGLNNNVGGYRNVVAGIGLNDYNESCRAIFGRYNKKNGQAVFVVGWGDNDENRKNIFWVEKSGKVRCSGKIYSVDGELATVASLQAASDELGIHRDNGDTDRLHLTAEEKADIGYIRNDVDTLIEETTRIEGLVSDTTHVSDKNSEDIGRLTDRVIVLEAPTVTEIPTTLAANTAYNFGSVEGSLVLSFPSNAKDGDVIYIGFIARHNTNLVVDTTNTFDFEIYPETDTGYEIYAKCTTNIGEVRWIVKYSEYTGVGK